MLRKLVRCFLALGFAASLLAETAAPSAASAPAAAPAMREGVIVAKLVKGTVTAQDNVTKAIRPIAENDQIRPGETVTTAKGRQNSAVLVFSNGATVNLVDDTALNIEEFMQEDWNSAVNVAQLTAEPTMSTTRLHLARGELVGKVAKLNKDRGSSFTVNTPVGAAGIRGTTFRIVFRPDPINPTRMTFAVSTAEGSVDVRMQGAVTTQAPLAVTGNREIVVEVEVNVNATTGQITITAPPQIVSTQPLSPSNQAAIVQATQAVVEAVQSVVIPVTPPASTPQPQTDQQGQQNQGSDNTSNTSTGSQNNSGTGTNTSGQSGNTPAPTPTPPTPTPPTPPAPPPVKPPPSTTPGAGGTG